MALGKCAALSFCWGCLFARLVINDVSTDVATPPKFVKADVGGLPEKSAQCGPNVYSDVKPLAFSDADFNGVFSAALEVASSIPSWELSVVDPSAGHLEGVDTTKLFKFKDDFAIRVEEVEGKGLVVDMRSASRTGLSDLGTNAKRIEMFMGKLSKVMSEKPTPQMIEVGVPAVF